MPTFPKGFSEDDYLELVARLKDVASTGPFDANDLLWSYMEERDFAPVNAGSVAGVLTDLEELGIIRGLGGDPPRWELVEEGSGNASTLNLFFSKENSGSVTSRRPSRCRGEQLGHRRD